MISRKISDIKENQVDKTFYAEMTFEIYILVLL